jgi:FO synthase
MVFTTGILIGIGETPEERVDALLAIRSAHQKYGHVQEVIVQPFRAKPDIRMAQAPEPSTEDLERTIAVARLIFGGEMNIQSPPNLLSEDYPDLLQAGINDWGGISPVTKDFINPEAAWPQISSLSARSAGVGFVLRERLAIYPEFASRPEFVNARLQPHLLKGLDPGEGRRGRPCGARVLLRPTSARDQGQLAPASCACLLSHGDHLRCRKNAPAASRVPADVERSGLG